MISIRLYFFIRGVAAEIALIWGAIIYNKKRKRDKKYDDGFFICLLWSIAIAFALGFYFVK